MTHHVPPNVVAEFAPGVAALGAPRGLWAIGPSTGRVTALANLHDALIERFVAGERLVYLGAYASADGRHQVIDELLLLRRLLLAKAGVHPDDIVWLRGRAEEAFLQLFRLPYAANPLHELQVLIAAGAGRYLSYYAFQLPDIFGVTRSGTTALTRWLGQLRQLMRQQPGHEQFWLSLKRAAITAWPNQPQTLLVPCGYAPDKKLAEQEKSWWDDGRLLTLLPRQPMLNADGVRLNRIVRGADPAGLGLETGPLLLTLDDADGTTPILLAQLTAGGKVEEIMTAACAPTAAEIRDMPEAQTDLPVATQFAARLAGELLGAEQLAEMLPAGAQLHQLQHKLDVGAARLSAAA